MRLLSYSAAALLASAIGAGLALAQSDSIPADTPTMIDGIETVCTGADSDIRDNPEWRAYPFQLEFVGVNGRYLGDEVISVTGNGHSMMFHCKGPWVLMKLPRGTYHVDMDVADAGHRTMTVRSPGHAIMRFQNAGGAAIGPRIASN
jgi:hypothetical protein